jgi:hypothetical protein
VRGIRVFEQRAYISALLRGMNPEEFLQRWTEGNINQQPKILTA